MINYQRKYIIIVLCFTINSLFAMDHHAIDLPACIKNAQKDQFDKYLTQEFASQYNTDLDVQFSKIHSAAKLTDDAIKLRGKRAESYLCCCVLGVAVQCAALCVHKSLGHGNSECTLADDALVAGRVVAGIMVWGSGIMSYREAAKHDRLIDMKRKLMALPILDRFRARFRQYAADLENQNDVAS